MSFTMDLRTREQQLIDLLLSTQDAITLQKQTDCMFNAQLNKNTKEGRLYFTIELGFDGTMYIKEEIFKDRKLAQWERFALSDGCDIATEEKLTEVSTELDFYEGMDRLKSLLMSC